MEVVPTPSSPITLKCAALMIHMLFAVLLAHASWAAAWQVGFHEPSQYLFWTFRVWRVWSAWLLFELTVAWWRPTGAVYFLCVLAVLATVAGPPAWLVGLAWAYAIIIVLLRIGLGMVRWRWRILSAFVSAATAYWSLSTWNATAMRGFAARVALVNSCVNLVDEVTRVARSSDVESSFYVFDPVVSNAFSMVFGVPVQAVCIQDMGESKEVFSYLRSQCRLSLCVEMETSKSILVKEPWTAGVEISLGLTERTHSISNFLGRTGPADQQGLRRRQRLRLQLYPRRKHMQRT